MVPGQNGTEHEPRKWEHRHYLKILQCCFEISRVIKFKNTIEIETMDELWFEISA